MIQRQFEFLDDRKFYIESHDTQLCGHFEVKTATLGMQSLRLEIPATTWKILQLKLATDEAGYEELKCTLEAMFEGKLTAANQDL